MISPVAVFRESSDGETENVPPELPVNVTGCSVVTVVQK